MGKYQLKRGSIIWKIKTEDFKHWWWELISPQPSLFVNTINRDIYKNMKW